MNELIDAVLKKLKKIVWVITTDLYIFIKALVRKR